MPGDAVRPYLSGISRTLSRCLLAAMTLAATSTVGSVRPDSVPEGHGPVVPALPGIWRVPAPRAATIDYALPARADAWLRHPVLGDPSFDAFERLPGNPIVRGRSPFRWPVNVSLLEDPVSGRWYAYVGFYLEGYAVGPGLPAAHCRVFRSADRGATWADVGPVFDDPSFRFEGDSSPANVAPDVTVVYHDGRYHMAYDWLTDNSTWETAVAPRDGADSGAGYAWAERPEGPFHRSPRPIIRTTEVQRWRGGSSRYRRAYATSLIRRKRDWLALCDLDSGPHYAWGQVALTARDPLGPWSPPVMVAGLEGDTYYPSPVEAFPAFVYGGLVYDPRTSVGANRNFQVIMRAPIEQAHRADAWSMYQHGSVWHAEWAPYEGAGIWGQTIAAAVDRVGRLTVLFPSRYSEDNSGAISAAVRPWRRPFRPRGFTLSAHAARSVTATRAAYADFDLQADLVLKGAAARIAWGYVAPLGAEGRADGAPHLLAWSRHCGLELTADGWRVLRADDSPDAETVAHGTLGRAERRAIRVTRHGGETAVLVDGTAVWRGRLAAGAGALGLLLEPRTNLTVTRFRVAATPLPAAQTWLYSEAISGAGVAEGSYTRVDGPQWRYRVGAVCRTPHERLKWSFRGRGFRLWSPKGPAYGHAAAVLDGQPLGEIALHAPGEQASGIVLERTGLADGFHALVLRGDTRPLPVDCLDALQ